MDIKTIIKMSLKAIASNKLRSFLTMLGIIIGVTSIIVLVSIGQGTTANITSSLQQTGSNKIIVRITNQGSIKELSYADLKDYKNIEGVSYVSPTLSSSITAAYESNSYDATLTGADENYIKINNYTLSTGRAITPLDMDNRNKVAILGSDVASELFSHADPINKVISVDGINYTVVGVLESKDTSSTGTSDDIILTPFTTAQRVLKNANISSFTVIADSSDDVENVMQNVELKLLSYFGTEDAYNVNNSQDLLDSITEVTNTLSFALGGIAFISLLVGGIGIMNIMLVSATERTKEIGIRKAVGAKKKDILMQFLFESAVISSLGGFIGILLAYIICAILSKFSISTVTSFYIVLTSFIFSLAIGIVFGIMPANKAAKLRPVDALRYE
ncbi:MAG: FtsX-like permease family protein [Eubacteriaceae bacterium]|nr:FtsX-like permease family protein [Eubacteriaceae bacterium]